jgi:hypothetical protein
MAPLATAEAAGALLLFDGKWGSPVICLVLSASLVSAALSEGLDATALGVGRRCLSAGVVVIPTLRAARRRGLARLWKSCNGRAAGGVTPLRTV